MSSNPPSAPAKASAPAGPVSPLQNQNQIQIQSQAASATHAFFGHHTQRPSAHSTSAPRNSQQSRRQNKPSKRFRQPDDDAIAESLAMRSSTNRKGQTSITHLMNFSLPPRPENHRSQGFRSSRRAPTWGLGSGYHAIDKARFVHANYRFIVDPRGDYRAQGVDADIHLDWNNVLQIIASSVSQDAACPICLGTPVAPRMARCGHIFCLPCLIRYMHAEDEGKAPEKRARSKACPICWDTIYASEARPVRWYVGQECEPPREGGDVVLRLLMRSAGSTLAMPRDGAEVLGKDEDIPWYFAAEVMDYARVMRGGEDYMLEQFCSEIELLQQQEKEDEVMFGEDNVQWMRKAIRNVQEAKEKIKGIGNPPESALKPAEPKPKRAPIVFNDEETPDMYAIQNAAKSGREEPSQPSETQRKMSTSSHGSRTSVPSTLAEIRNRQHQEQSRTPNEYYFYQAPMHYYLSPLDIRILKSAFEHFSAFPSTILPRVERVSTGHVVDDDLRKRTKYLAHLPYGCEVGFLECDWTDTVAPEVLARFKPDIEKRRKRFHEKETREEKARQRAEKAEYAEFTSARRKRPSITERFSADDFAPLTSTADTDSASPPHRGPGFDSLASPSTSPSAPRTVWGTTAVPGASPVLGPTGDIEDGWLQGWEKELLGEEEMIAQAQALSLGGEEGGGEASTPKPAGKGKKKKKITLMSTQVRRGA